MATSVDPMLRQAISLLQQQRHPEAELLYRKVLEIEPRNTDALLFLGVARHQQGDNAQALDLMQKAIALRPGVSSYHNNFGEVLRAENRVDEALEQFQTALQLNPNNAQAHNNVGIVRESQNRPADAIPCYDRAIQIRPDYARPHWNRALCHLKLGDYRNGFIHYEWRWGNHARGRRPRQFPQPQWDGNDPHGKTIFVHAEQGFGDTMQFVRFVPQLADQANVILEVQPELKTLIERSLGGDGPIDTVIAAGDAIPPFDAHVPLLSLPRLFRTTLETIPAQIPYLTADAAKSGKWKSRLAAEPTGKKIGIVWASRPSPDEGNIRTAPLRELLPILRWPGARFYSLQKSDAATEIAPLQDECAIVDWTSELADFDDAAALLANLDLLITIDTAAAHLAGAMGKPAWVLLPFQSEWRWLMNRNDSPWYPTLRLFRQAAPGDWERLARLVAAEISKT